MNVRRLGRHNAGPGGLLSSDRSFRGAQLQWLGIVLAFFLAVVALTFRKLTCTSGPVVLGATAVIFFAVMGAMT